MSDASERQKTRTVEYYRCWDDGTWNTEFLDIPADTPEDELDEAVKEAAAKLPWKEDVPVVVGLYCSMDDDTEAWDWSVDDAGRLSMSRCSAQNAEEEDS